MDCPNCGEELFVIEGLHFDRDGIRNARYCADCHIVYGVHAAGFSIHAKLHLSCNGKGKVVCPACHGDGKIIKE